jgi:V/A-type H+-transporting ATPase subunit E
VTKILQTGVKRAEALKRQIVGAAELEVRNAHLRTVEEAVNHAFSTAISRISTASTVRYERSIVRLIKEGTNAIGPRAVVFCKMEDRELVASIVRELNEGPTRLTVDSKNLDTVGGVALGTSNGSLRFDNTFEARLQRMKSELRKDVAALLSG